MRGMKATICLVILAMVLTGCRENYFAEKEFYKASKLFEATNAQMAQQAGVGTEILDPVVQAFQKVAERYPTTSKAAESLFIISNLRVRQGQFDSAREALQSIIRNFSSTGSWALDARYKIAQLYEQEGDWDRAEKAYWEVADYHYLHPKGLYAPMHTVSHYKTSREPDHARRVYYRAVDHYERKLREVGPIKDSAGLRYFLGLTHMAMGYLEEAEEVLGTLSESYPDSGYAPMSLMTAAEIAWKNENDKEAATYYSLLFDQYPDHQIAGNAAIRRGVLYLKQGQYEECRSWLHQAIDRYFKNDEQKTAEIKIVIGESYQKEGRWTEAETFYRKIQADHATTETALRIPLIISARYKAEGDQDKANRILNEAIQHYQTIESTSSSLRMAGFAKFYRQAAYGQLGKWDQVMSNLDQEIATQSSVESMGNYLLMKAFISERGLQDADQALNLYQEFLSQYPDHPLTGFARAHADVLINS